MLQRLRLITSSNLPDTETNNSVISGCMIWLLLATSICLWVLMTLFFHSLSYDLLYDSDGWYYLNAANGLERFMLVELPAYPALVRVSLTILPDVAPRFIMGAIALVAYSVSWLFLYALLRTYRLSNAFTITILTGVYPLIGLVMAVHPRVNSLIFATLFAALYFHAIRRYTWAAIIFALVLLTHKAIWPVVGLFSVFSVAQRHMKLGHLVIIFGPLAAYWIAGSMYHDDLTWLLSFSVNKKFAANDAFVPLQGLMQSIINTVNPFSLKEALRLIVILFPAVVVVWLLIIGVWRQRWWLLSFMLPIFLWLVLLNEEELFSIVNYSIALVIPVAFALEDRYPALNCNRWFWILLLGAALASQIAFAVYTSTLWISNARALSY